MCSRIEEWLVGAVVAVLMAASQPAAAAVGQPGQPKTGPGGSSYSQSGVRVSQGGVGADAWYAFEPTAPQPKTAPVSVIMHGYFEFSGYGSQRLMIDHTVRKGGIVIYPRWQTGLTDPCPGPFEAEPCLAAAVAGIKGALAHLRNDPSRVQPDTNRMSYFGLSFGGILTANMTNRYRQLGLPKPRVIFLDDPHDGGYKGSRESGLDKSLGGIPSDALVQCHSGAHGIFDDTYTGTDDIADEGKPKADGSCNQVFPRLTSVPPENKDLVLTSEDPHGEPALTSDHAVCASRYLGLFNDDAYDWGFCWKVWDAMRSAAFEHKDCEYALGDTPQHRYIGTWSDGVPVVGLKVQDEAPIRANPVPARQAEVPAARPTRAGLCGDRLAPRLKLRYPKRQAVNRLAVTATSTEVGRVRLRAWIRTRGKGARTYRVKQVVKQAQAGKSVRLRLRLRTRALRRLTRTLRGYPARGSVVVSTRDEAGNLRKVQARIGVRK